MNVSTASISSFHATSTFSWPPKLRLIGILEFLASPLEFGKTSADEFRFPAVIKLYADFLLGESPLPHSYAWRQVFRTG